MTARIVRDVAENPSNPSPSAAVEKTSNGTENSNDSSSEELTMADVEKLKTELAQEMSIRDATLLTNVLKKFTEETTDEEKLQGFVSATHCFNCGDPRAKIHYTYRISLKTRLQMKVVMIGMAVERNQTDAQIMKMLAAFDSSEDKEMAAKKIV